MKNNKGQALVEFIIILPIFLLLIISVIDFGNIISKKYSLENEVDTVSIMYKSEKYDEINKYLKEKDIIVNYENNDEFTKIILNKEVSIISPMLNLILGNTYNIKVEKSIYKG